MNPLSRIKDRCHNLYNHILFLYRSIDYPKTLTLRGKIHIAGTKHPDILLGNHIIINSSARSNPAGGGQKQTLFAIYEGARLSIGDYSGLSNSTIVCGKEVTIGEHVNIGVNCVIYDTDMHSVDYQSRMQSPDQHKKNAPVTIEDGVWICGHCIILKGVTIGTRSVVAAGSVVTKDIPEDELWGGNPAKFIRKINQNKT